MIRCNLYYFFVFIGGCTIGLVTCLAGEMQSKWFIIYVIAVLLLSVFTVFKQKQKMALGLFVFFLPFFVVKKICSSDYPMITGGPSSIGIFLYDLPLLFLLFCFIKEKIFEKSTSIYCPPIFKAVILFILWCGISIINSIEPSLSLIEFVWLCKMALILILIVNLVKERSDLFLLIFVLVVGLFIQEIVTFSQAYLKAWYTFTGDIEYTAFKTERGTSLFRAGGTVGPHNVQAAYYVLLIPLAAGIYFGLQGRLRKILTLIVIFCGIFSLILTYSRNGYLSLICAMMVLLYSAWRRRLLNKRHLIVVAWIIVIGLSAIFLYSGESIIERMQSNAAFEPRFESLKIAVNMIKKHPVAGIGLNNFSIVMGEKDYSPEGISPLQQTYFGGEFFGTVVHNKYMLIASEVGIIGLVIFIWILSISFSYSLKLLKNQKLLFWGIGAGLISALTGASVQMLFDIYNSDLLITVFWVLVGLLFASYKVLLEEEKELYYAGYDNNTEDTVTSKDR